MNYPTTPFPLGVMAGGPNGSDPVQQAATEARLTSFQTLMGAAPLYMNAFVDAKQPISRWADNSGWTAWSWRQSPLAAKTIPVIGLPMAPVADAADRAATYRAFAAGTHDAALRGVVTAWRDQGFTSAYIRPGYEMNGTYSDSYAGADAASRAAWVAAFKHIANVVRTVPGIDVKTVWNPNLQAGNTADVASLYPGNAAVDVIAGDMYNPTYPRDLYDWSKNDGSYAPDFPTWFADPVNRAHFWEFPAANQWNQVSDGQSHTFALSDLIKLARLHNKPLAIAETGAGGDGTRAPTDDPAFPKWLANALSQSGVPIAFVNIWDLHAGDADWSFSGTGSGSRPLEAAVWASYFGAGSIGTGPDTITVQLSADAFRGDARVAFTLDGVALGPARDVSASHAAGARQTFSIHGTFGKAPQTLGVQFLNDAWGGPGQDRNLYIDQVSLNGASLLKPTPLYWEQTVNVAIPSSAPARIDTLTINVSEDAYAGHAQFLVSVDGKQQGGVHTASAAHNLGHSSALTFSGDFGAGPHSVAVSFLNDAWGGAGKDRNLFVDSVAFNGKTVPAASASFFWNSSHTFGIPASPDAVLPGRS